MNYLHMIFSWNDGKILFILLWMAQHLSMLNYARVLPIIVGLRVQYLPTDIIPWIWVFLIYEQKQLASYWTLPLAKLFFSCFTLLFQYRERPIIIWTYLSKIHFVKQIPQKASGECSDVKLNLSCGVFKTKLLREN